VQRVGPVSASAGRRGEALEVVVQGQERAAGERDDAAPAAETAQTMPSATRRWAAADVGAPAPTVGTVATRTWQCPLEAVLHQRSAAVEPTNAPRDTPRQPMPSESTVILKPISRQAAEALAAGRLPEVPVAPGYPTEFSAGVGQHAGVGRGLGPFFIHRVEDDAVVGEIGAAFVEEDTIEIGYAIVESVWGRGHATDAVRAIVALARREPAIARVLAHTPLDRPASGRVVEKAGFTSVGEVVDEHEGAAIRVIRWELRLNDAA
jgi:RimJ/RimL family protein N-acetyltransferase